METAKRVKVLFCIDKLARGGTELQLISLINRLDRTRFEPYLFTLRHGDAGVLQVDCPHFASGHPRIYTPQGLKSIMDLAIWLKKNRFDVVQTFFQDSSVVGGFAAKMAGVPVRIACFRDMGFWRNGGPEVMLNLAYRSMTHFIANSEMVMNQAIAGFGLKPGNCQVINNGVDQGALPWVAHDGPTTDVGIVGNLNRKVKRTDLFIKAAGQLKPEFPDVTWHILGEGRFRADYEELATMLGLGNRVIFAGSVTDVPRYLQRLQVGVICSDSEGLSNALLEYLFRGCAAIATDVGGNPELVHHRETGLLVPPDDPEGLAAAIREILLDTKLRITLARNARDFAEKNYSWELCLAKHEALFTDPGKKGSRVTK